MGPEVGFLKQQSNLTSSLFSMHLEIEKIEKDHSELFGFLELMLELESLEFRIQN
jgi:hypothetical protein